MHQCQRRVQKLTGNPAIILMLYKPTKLIPFEDIIDIICAITGISEDVILQRNRQRDIVITRQLICFYGKYYSNISHPRIASRIGYTNHTTSIHSIDSIKDLIHSGDPYVTSLVSKINQQLIQIQ